MKKRKISIYLVIVLSLLFLLSMRDSSVTNMNSSALVTSDSIEVFSDNDFITLGFPGSGTVENPYLIENYDIVSSDINNEGVYVQNTTKHFVIQNCEITNSFYGILVEDIAPDTCQILNNRLYENKHDGAALKNSSGVIIAGNLFEDGIVAAGMALDHCSNVLFANNTIRNHHSSGLLVYSSSDINITRNIIKNSKYKGISIINTSNCTIYKNQFELNDEHGIDFVQNCINNIIYHNNFIDNFLVGGICQARDSDGMNTWYNSLIQEGNYWSDYSGTGNYTIEGEEGCCDLYPLTEPVNLEEPKDPDTNGTSFTYLLFTFLYLPIVYRFRKKRA
ncbi:MAG: right-handed parallel beta-helix repeat-containing protein [Candidatus Heimdallarchaeaceae archaeon]